MELPKTKQQSEFEQFAPVLINVISNLSEQGRNKVFNYAISIYNKEEKRK